MGVIRYRQARRPKGGDLKAERPRSPRLRTKRPEVFNIACFPAAAFWSRGAIQGERRRVAAKSPRCTARRPHARNAESPSKPPVLALPYAGGGRARVNGATLRFLRRSSLRSATRTQTSNTNLALADAPNSSRPGAGDGENSGRHDASAHSDNTKCLPQISIDGSQRR